jgi:hypothetical protein
MEAKTGDNADGYEIDWNDDRGVYLHKVVKKFYKLRDSMRRDFFVVPDIIEYEQLRLNVNYPDNSMITPIHGAV